MASLPVVIFQFAMSPYKEWQDLAWAGALLITLTVLALSIVGPHPRRRGSNHDHAATALPEKISIRDLKFFYGANQALKNITLPLYEKRATAFIGPSGCGKSTLLRVLNRMYDLYPKQRAEGEIMFDGENILSPGQDLNLLRARIGMVFQKPTPFPMSIYDNIAFGIRLYEDLPRSEMDGRVETALRGAALWSEVKDKLGACGLASQAASSSACASHDASP